MRVLEAAFKESFADGRALQVDVHNNLGDLWRAQGALGRVEAQNCYQEALQIDPHYAPAWRGLGDLFRESNDHNQAIAYYQVRVWYHISI